jgi:hypothetical protein
MLLDLEQVTSTPILENEKKWMEKEEYLKELHQRKICANLIQEI